MIKLKELLNEASPDRDLYKALNHDINNRLFKIVNKYEGKADLDIAFRTWMNGLHHKLKKAGIKL
jgi:hypothetical protein